MTLLRNIGPYRESIYIIGGLVPRYLIDRDGVEGRQPHVGTTDVDLVLDFELISGVEAYRSLEENLLAADFERGRNDRDNPQQHRWYKRVAEGIRVVVDILCDESAVEGGKIAGVPGERRLRAIRIPGATLAARDYIEVTIRAELLDGRGVAEAQVRVANIVPFIVLKALAYEDRFEEKDAYDLVYALSYYKDGPTDVARAFMNPPERWSDEPLLRRAVDILRSRFATDDQHEGYVKDGSVSYARFMTDPGQPDMDVGNRRNASGAVELFLSEIDRLNGIQN